MSNIAHFILFFFLFTYIQSYIDNECLSSQECITESSSRIKCSEYGKCVYSYNNVLISNYTSVNAIECKCIKGYTNLNEDAEVKCCYKQKKQLTAFILEMIFSLGVGHFYRGHTFFGLLKINNGIIHIYFFLAFFTGYLLSFVIYKKICCKKK